MSPSEDTWLAARAARSPELETFRGGFVQVLIPAAYLAAAAAVFAFSVAVGHLIAFPLGFTHSSQGKTFVPADSLKGNEGAVSYFNVCGAILGFPLYSLGYLAGLSCAPEKAPAKAPPIDSGRIEIFLLGLTEQGPEGQVRLAGVSAAADRAGLQIGDVVLEIDDVAVTRANLAAVLARSERRESVEVAVVRDGCRLRMAISTQD